MLTIQELCVCELEEILEMSQPRVSKHLKVLKKAGVIFERKERQKSFFRLSPEIEGGLIVRFSDFMQCQPDQVRELEQEIARFKSLEANARVQACKAKTAKP
ncbi:MAG: ArsR/SmtB family transcription factor [Solirubrobacterales bacterium]